MGVTDIFKSIAWSGVPGLFFAIGVIMFSMSFTTAMVSAQLGKLTRRFAKRNLAIFAFCAYVVALAIIPFVGRLELFVIPTWFSGWGMV